MKLKFILLAIAAFAVFGLSSCKKSSTADDVADIETTFDLSAKGGVAENLTQDAADVLNEAAKDNNIAGSGFVGGIDETTGILSCATVTVTAVNPPQAFPKNIVIDFGTTGCTSNNPNGTSVTRKGKILVNLTDSLRKAGSVATMNFDNYTVGIYKKEGTITWTNTSTANTRSWNRNCVNGKITNTITGAYWLHSGIQDIVQTAGVGTSTLLDDVYSITGGRTVTNANNVTRVGTILTALQKKTACTNIDLGTYKIQGPNHYAIIDFGYGTPCDDQASISIDGRPARTFTLR